MRFDISTAMMMTSLLTLAVGASLTFATARYPAHLRDAMRVWIGGLMLQTLSLLAVGTLGPGSSPAVVVASNALYALAYAEMGRALHLFNFSAQRRGPWPIGLVAAVVLFSFAFAVVWDTSRWRIVLIGPPLAALQFAVTRSILRAQARRPADYMTAALFFACGVLTLTRCATELLGPGIVAEPVHQAMRTIVLVFSAFLPTIGTIGFMLMCGDRLNDDLARLAMVDPLTGVYNRRTLAGLAAEAIARAQRESRPLALLAVDVDHFKRINDRFGHDGGDEALRLLVAGMQASLDEQAVLSRIGGEEFAVLLPDRGEEEACATAERLRRHLERTELVVDGQALPLCVSIGVAEIGSAPTDLAALLREADRALYAAKRAGRNRVVAASSLEAAPRRDAEPMPG
jgi:diguanylate cyclase (GGDEF)-like protein